MSTPSPTNSARRSPSYPGSTRPDVAVEDVERSTVEVLQSITLNPHRRRWRRRPTTSSSAT